MRNQIDIHVIKMEEMETDMEETIMEMEEEGDSQKL